MESVYPTSLATIGKLNTISDIIMSAFKEKMLPSMGVCKGKRLPTLGVCSSVEYSLYWEYAVEVTGSQHWECSDNVASSTSACKRKKVRGAGDSVLVACFPPLFCL